MRLPCHRGQSLNQLAAFFAVRYATAHGWLQAWNEQGLAGLRIKAITVYVAAATMLFNLLTDLLYQAVDPRVQLK